MKNCTGCHAQKDLSCFGRSKSRKDGLDKYCRECRRSQYQARKAGNRVYRHYPAKVCVTCGQSYQPTTGSQKICSVACRRMPPQVCGHCAREFVSSHRQKFCSRTCVRLSRVWKVGSRGDGYLVITVPAGTPGRRSDGRMLEHRYLMQQLLGRELLSTEDVHHINGDKADNRTDGPLVDFKSGNLELWSCSQPRGQRISDKVAWAREVLALYGGNDV